MITNIVDDRKNNKKWNSVYGTIEPTFHDNSCKDADQAIVDTDRSGICVMTKSPMTLTKLLIWAESFPGENTLYIRNTDPMGKTQGW